jgi:RNA polymerase sigma-70 factor (ECF subfamily)
MIRYGELVMRIVSRHIPGRDAEEVAQEVFVRAYESLPSFKGQGAFRNWLSSIAVRTCHDYWRKAYRCREVPMTVLTDNHREWLEELINRESEQALVQKNSRREAGDLLNWALSKISPENRMVLELVYLEGLSVKEAAVLLGWSTANVKVRALRSRKKMESLLAGVLEGKGRIA